MLQNEPLYSGAPLTVNESMLMIMALFVKHNLTKTCLADIINLINLHCIAENLIEYSLYKFKTYFNISLDEVFRKHFYCSVCPSEKLESEQDRCETCREKTQVSYFIELPFLNQLQEMYKRDEFYESLQHRFYRQVPPNTINDIYDASIYQQYTEPGEFLSGADNISLGWYTDGIPVFKSSRVSMSPLFLIINELPFNLRFNRENILMAGLWFGNKKLAANHFLREFRDVFYNFFNNGYDFYLPRRPDPVNVKGLLIFGACDLPAKAQFLNLVQFNGKYGCPNCLNQGETFVFRRDRDPENPEDNPRAGHTHIYRYERNVQLRTSAETMAQGLEAEAIGRPVKGVKGPSALALIMPNHITGTGIDRMHGVDGGVIKKLLNLWFTPKYHESPFSLTRPRDLVDVIDTWMKNIKPPKWVHRYPRSIADLIHWKASELRMWMFYYSLPILSSIMRPNYYHHYLLLVSSISILSSDSISNELIDVAETLLNLFVEQFQVLYGLEHCSINVHQLQHYPQCVRSMGSLCDHLCYRYEDLNGKFLKFIHGTWHIDTQVAQAHTHYIGMKRKLDDLPEGNIKNFCLAKKHQVKLREQIADHCYSVGSYSQVLDVLPIEVDNAMQCSQIFADQVQTYSRLLKNGKLYVAESYLKDMKTISSYVQYTENNETLIGSVVT